MAEFTREQILTALRNADAAGDVEAATRLARMAKDMEQVSDPRMDMRAGRGTNRAEGANMAPKRPSTTADYLKSQAASLAAGAFDPIAGTEQLVLDPRNVSPIGRIMQLVDIGVGKLTGEQRGQAGALQRQQERDVAVNELREQAGREGIDFTRIGGSILNPVSLYTGRGIPGGGTALQRVGYGAGMGTLAGAAAPLSDQERNFVEDKLIQAGFGGVVGGAIPLTVEGAKKIIGFIKDLPISQANKTRALQEYIVDKAGPNREAVIKALREADEIVPGSKPTVSDALSDTPEAVGLIKEQQRVAATQKQGPSFISRDTEREAARQAELTGAFGTADDITALQATRDAQTGAIRQQALSQADEAKTALKEIDDLGKKELSRIISQNKELFPEEIGVDERFVSDLPTSQAEITRQFVNRTRALKDTQLKLLEQTGTYPIYAKDLLSEIDDRITKETTDIGKTALRGIRAKIASKADENGILSSQDLYDNVRKTINQDIEALLQQGEKQASGGLPQQAAKAAADIKKAIDASINKTSNGLWSKYLSDFQKYSQKLDQMAVGQALKKKLGEGSLGDVEKAGSFAQAVQNAPQLIKRTTGAPRYEKIEDFLTKDQVASVNRVLADLNRSKKAQELAKKIERDAPDLLTGARDAPQFLDARLTAFKGLMESLRRGSRDKFDARIAELMADPKALATFLEAIPKKDANTLAVAMYAKMSPQMQQAFQQYFPTASSVQSGVITQTVRD